MANDALLTQLLTRLHEVTCFEEAAVATLASMFGCAQEALQASSYASTGRLLRGVVHVRPADSYQRLFGIEYPSGTRVGGTGYLTSANIWRWVVEHRSALSVDVPHSILRMWSDTARRFELPESAAFPDMTRAGA